MGSGGRSLPPPARAKRPSLCWEAFSYMQLASPTLCVSGIIRRMQLVETSVRADVPSLGALRELVSEDWSSVNRVIFQRLGSDVALVNQVAHHIIHNGGKRLRPLTVLLAARACGCADQAHIPAAAII